ncbi:MAG: hypothetical protein ACI378_00005 [Bacteroides sp.]
MKTRHILTALALPALFAACTADEFVNEGISTQGSRAKLSKDLTLTTLGEADTRYSVSDNMVISFEAGDKLGACIIDDYNASFPNEPEKWTVIKSLAGNYPFTFDGSVWKSDIELGIGHYLFVYPYNKGDNNRAAASFELPTVQELYDTEDGPVVLGAAVQKANRSVAATVMYEGDVEKDITLRNIYTYPKFVINLDNGEKVTTVSQVVLKKTTGVFVTKGGFDHQTLAKMAKNDISLNSQAYWDNDNECVDWSKVQTADMLLSYGDRYTTSDKSEYLIAKLPNNTKVKVDGTTNNKYVEVSFMMPSVADFSVNQNINMYVYTDNGIYEAALSQDNIDFKSTTSQETKDAVLSRGKGLTLKMKKTAFTKAAESTVGYIVTDMEDWNALVANYGASTVNIPVAVVGNGFAFESGVKMPSKATFTISTPVSVKGNMTIKNVKVTGVLTVEKGAVLTTDPTFEATSIINKGEIIFTAMPETRAVVANVTYTGVSEITNENKVTVPAEVNAAFAITNGENATLENKGEVTIQANSTNKGVINNDGVLNVNGLENLAEWDASAEAFKYQGTINNAKGAEIVSEAADGLKNGGKAVIVNEGSVSSLSNGATIENAGILYAKGEVNYLTDNTSTGKIVVYKAMPDNVVLTNSNAGIVEYTATKASEAFATATENSIVTDVIANGSLAITKVGLVKRLTINGTSTLSVEADKSIANVTIAAGTTTLGSNLIVGKLVVAKGAKIIVNAGKTLTVSSALENKGAIQVGGTFTAKNVSAADGGTVTQSGTSAKVVWQDTPDPEGDKKAARKAAMEDAVGKWAGYWNTYMGNQSSYSAYYAGNPFDYSKFAAVINYGDDNWNATKTALETAGFEADELKVTKPTEPAEFAAAVDEVLKAKKSDAEPLLFNYESDGKTIKDFIYSVSADATLYDTEAKAKDGLCATIAEDGSTFAGDYVAAAYAWYIQSTVYTKAMAKNPNLLIWKDCDLDKLVEIWKTYDGALGATVDNKEYSDFTASSATGKATALVAWVKIVLGTTSTGNPNFTAVQKDLSDLGITVKTITKFGDYSDAQMHAVDNALLIP